jgi:hypothetical protein
MTKEITLYVNPWGASIPGTYTVSAVKLTQELEQIYCLISFVCASGKVVRMNYAQFRDECVQNVKSRTNPFIGNTLRAVDAGADSVLFSDKTYEKLVSQMVYSRMVDGFLGYMKGLLAEIVASEPRLLKSNETERLDFILSFDEIAELRTALAERKIERLFYGGFEDIAEFYLKRIGVEVSPSEEALQRLTLMTKLRNLIVHNGGVVSRAFKKEYPDSPFSEGDRIEFNFDSIMADLSFLLDTALALDQKVASKFHLSLGERCGRIPTDEKPEEV